MKDATVTLTPDKLLIRIGKKEFGVEDFSISISAEEAMKFFTTWKIPMNAFAKLSGIPEDDREWIANKLLTLTNKDINAARDRMILVCNAFDL
jgi:hypothetical protein